MLVLEQSEESVNGILVHRFPGSLQPDGQTHLRLSMCRSSMDIYVAASQIVAECFTNNKTQSLVACPHNNIDRNNHEIKITCFFLFISMLCLQ